VARSILEFIFENQGSSWNFVDCRLLLDKERSLFAKRLASSSVGFIFQWKTVWTRCTSRGPAQGAVHDGPTTMVGHVAPGGQPSGRSRPRRLAVRWGKLRGGYGDSVLVLTRDGEATWWCGGERLNDSIWELINGAQWPLRRGEEVGFGCDEV
jgi:hypothetical protein